MRGTAAPACRGGPLRAVARLLVDAVQEDGGHAEQHGERQGPGALALAVLLGMAAVFLHGIDKQTRDRA